MAMRWYVIQAYSGFEKKVAETIKEQRAKQNLESQIEEVLVPAEEVVELRRGKKVNAERKFFPGYVLIRMEMTDQTWHLVKSTPKVNGFLGEGSGNRPTPMSDQEAEYILNQVVELAEKPRYAIRFEVGEQIRVIDGPFQSFNAVVEEVNDEKARLKVAVSIFGRSTPVELDFDQVEKLS